MFIGLGLKRRVLHFVQAIVLALPILFQHSSHSAFAQTAPPTRPSGSVAIHQVQVAFIGSGMLGGGTLYFRGRSYPFKLGGLGIGGMGVSRLNASGSVFNLRRITDFNGVYGQVRSGWAAGDQGKGKLWMQNSNGVYLRLTGVRSGLSLTMGADGVRIQLGG